MNKEQMAREVADAIRAPDYDKRENVLCYEAALAMGDRMQTAHDKEIAYQQQQRKECLDREHKLLVKLSRLVPEGSVVVPVEPSEDMLEAGVDDDKPPQELTPEEVLAIRCDGETTTKQDFIGYVRNETGLDLSSKEAED